MVAVVLYSDCYTLYPIHVLFEDVYVVALYMEAWCSYGLLRVGLRTTIAADTFYTYIYIQIPITRRIGSELHVSNIRITCIFTR